MEFFAVVVLLPMFFTLSRLNTQLTMMNSLSIGALMDARGPMESIMLSIGLQRGIIGPALFSMLVVVAIVTTLMASPLFGLVYGR